MPVETADNYVRVRVRDPEDFEKDSFRTIDVSEENGIKAVVGKLEGEESTTIQTYLFDKEKWDEEKAEAWVKEHKKQVGFKAIGNKWVGAWTNAFEDRDREILSTAAIAEYTEWANKERRLPELWFWHMPNPIGTVEWMDIQGRFGVAAGTLNEWGLKIASAIQDWGDWGMSHRFMWDEKQFTDGVYDWFRTVELSLLPKGRAANVLTSFSAPEEMEMTDEQRNALSELVGPEQAKAFLEAVEARDKAAELAGLQSKEEQTVQSIVLSDDVIEAIAGKVAALLKPADLDSVKDALVVLADQVKALKENDDEKIKAALEALPKREVWFATRGEAQKEAPAPAEAPKPRNLADSIKAIQEHRAARGG